MSAQVEGRGGSYKGGGKEGVGPWRRYRGSWSALLSRNDGNETEEKTKRSCFSTMFDVCLTRKVATGVYKFPFPTLI